MKSIKKLMCILLSITMLVTILPGTNVFAGTSRTLNIEGGQLFKWVAPAGEKVTINAVPPEEGMVFDKWVSDDIDTTYATDSTFVLIMPDKNATIKATYKPKNVLKDIRIIMWMYQYYFRTEFTMTPEFDPEIYEYTVDFADTDEYYEYGIDIGGGFYESDVEGQSVRFWVLNSDGSLAYEKIPGGGQFVFQMPPHGLNFKLIVSLAGEADTEYTIHLIRHTDTNFKPAKIFFVTNGTSPERRLPPTGFVNEKYGTGFTLHGRPAPSGSIIGELPPGLNLIPEPSLQNEKLVTIQGTPTQAGKYDFIVKSTNSVGDTEIPMSITIKENTKLLGKVSVSGVRKFGETLTASLNNNNNTGTLSYTWKDNNDNIIGTGKEYIVQKSATGKRITCDVESSRQYNVISSNDIIIAKADGPKAPIGLKGVPTSVGRSDGKIRETTNLMEYADNTDFTDAKDCDYGQTTGLKAGTYYVRLKTTETHEAGEHAKVVVEELALVESPLKSFTKVVFTQTGDIANDNVQYTTSTAIIAALPKVIEVTLVNGLDVNVPISWTDTDSYNPDVVGNYTFTGTWGTMPGGANNDNNLGAPTVEVKVVEGTLTPVDTSYTVTFNSNDGSTVSPIIGIAKDGTVILLAVPTKAGFVFGGWYTEAGLTNKFTGLTPVTANITVYAKWTAVTAETYTVTFDSNEGSTVAAITAIDKDATVTLPTTPTKAGYVFDGWYKEAGLTNEFTGSTPVTANITVYAKWTAVTGGGSSSSKTTTYTIKTTAGEGGIIDAAKTISVKAGKDLRLNIKPNKGYEIEGVKVDGKLVGVVMSYEFTNVRDDHTISATFKKIEKIEPEIKEAKDFNDVAKNEWYYDSVMNAFNKGWFSGTSDTTFSPNIPMSRGMIVTVLWRMEGEPVSMVNSFNDVLNDDYYTTAVRWAAEKGIVNGYGNNLFGPNEMISREQMASILYRYAQYKSYDTTQGGMAIREFLDYENISEYALPTLAWGVNTGLMQGANNKLMPKDSATRAQVATMLMRFSEIIVN